MRRLLILAMVSSIFASEAMADDDLSHFMARDVFELEWADDPQISPDGTQALYLRRFNDIMADRTRSHVWLVDLDDGNHQPLMSDRSSYRSARWSPDGGRIAYLKSGNGQTELYVHYMASGRNALISTFETPPSGLVWSPNGDQLAFSMPVKGETKSLFSEPKAPKAPDGATWAASPIVIDRARYRTNADGFLELAYDHIFVIPAEGGTRRQLTTGDFNHDGRLAFTPEGEEILFSANRNTDWELQSREKDIFSVHLRTGNLTQLTDSPGEETDPTPSVDGKHIAYKGSGNAREPYLPVDVFVMKRDGAGTQNLTADLDRRVDDLEWMSATELTYTFENRGEKHVGAVDLTGQRRTVVRGIGGTTIGRPYLSGAYDVTGDAGADGTIVFTKGSAQRPADLYASKNGVVRRLTTLNEDLLEHRNLGEVQSFTYASSLDGLEIQGWMITPPDYEPGQTYPLIIEIHGGPHLAYGPHFSAELQRMAAEGYVVIYDNHRGSSGYGSAFANLLKYKYSSPDDFADHMSAVDWAIDQGYADKDNLFIAGGSAGGIAAAYAIGLTDRFNAAVAVKPVINWVSKVLTADSYISQIANQFPGPPWEHLQHYWDRSPLSLVGNVTTPTMLITGEEDWRTPISETEQFYQALQLRRVPSVMVRMPGSNHGIAGRPSRLNAKTDYTIAWFDQYRTDQE